MDAANKHWTIGELGRQVERALADGYDGQRSGRVRAVPDRRTIRYYTTLGLIDRPARMQGRTALYSRRHLMQVVAIKRLQSDGLTLAQVQQKLAGITDHDLAELARLPEQPVDDNEGADEAGADEVGANEVAADEDEAGEQEPVDRRADFWQRVPGPVASPPPDQRPGPRAVTALQLAPGVTLLVDGQHELDPDQLAEAARPLLEALAGRDEDM